MKLIRPIRVVLGLAATSGVVLVLSGSALAADAGSATTPQKAAPLSAVIESPLKPANDAGLSSDSKQVPQASQQEQKPVTDTNKLETKPSVTVSDGSKAQVSADAGKVNLGPVVDAPTKATGVLANGGVLATESSVSEPKDNVTVILPEITTGVKTPSLATEPQVIAIKVAPLERAAAGVTIYRSAVLPIQPTITSRATAMAIDLAAALPSVPVPDNHLPAPAKSTGLLGQFTAEMAGVVVPQPVSPFSTAVERLMLAVDLMTLVLLLGNVFTFTYGQWLRRGGFATAARSDSPVVATFSSFATPRLLGYVSMPPHRRSPIFVVAEISKMVLPVPNAFRKEDMR